MDAIIKMNQQVKVNKVYKINHENPFEKINLTFRKE